MDIQKFIELFANAIEVDDILNLSAETDFRDLDEWSSLSVMLLIAMFDENFDKQVGDKEIRTCSTIQDLYNLAQR